MSADYIDEFRAWAKSKGANDRDLDGLETRDSGLIAAQFAAWRAAVAVVREHDGAALTAEREVERETVADWMAAHSYATGPGDTIDDLLGHLGWQIKEERERVARLDSELMAAQVEARLWNDAVKDRRVLPIGSYYGPDDKVPVRQP